jgi:citrate lyase subunit beta/citryl-CoA lyase
MVVLRSVMYTPGNNERLMESSKKLRPDVLVLDVEDSVPYPEVPKARQMIRERLKEIKEATGSLIYSRIHDWRTGMTEADLGALVIEGIDGFVLSKTEGAKDVYLLDNRLTQLEKERGLKVGSIAIQSLIETTRGMLLASEAAAASYRLNSFVFGALDYVLDKHAKLNAAGTSVGRDWTVIAARSNNLTAIDSPYPDYKDVEGFRKDTSYGREMGYEGRMLIHPSQIEPANEIYSPNQEDIDHAKEVVALFEDAMKKGMASVPLRGAMVDTPVYRREMDLLNRLKEIQEAEARKKPL